MNRPLEKRLGERGSQKKVMQGKTTRKKSRKQEGRQRKVMHLQKEILPKQWARKKSCKQKVPIPHPPTSSFLTVIPYCIQQFIVQASQAKSHKYYPKNLYAIPTLEPTKESLISTSRLKKNSSQFKL